MSTYKVEKVVLVIPSDSSGDEQVAGMAGKHKPRAVTDSKGKAAQSRMDVKLKSQTRPDLKVKTDRKGESRRKTRSVAAAVKSETKTRSVAAAGSSRSMPLEIDSSSDSSCLKAGSEDEEETKCVMYLQWMNQRQRGILDSMVSTDGIELSCAELRHVQGFIRSLDTLYAKYHCGHPRTSKLLVHTLSATNLTKKTQLKLPRRVVPDRLDESGALTIVLHPHTVVDGSYSWVKTKDDGRLSVFGWKWFIKMSADHLELKIKDRIVLLFCRGQAKSWLFVDRLGGVE